MGVGDDGRGRKEGSESLQGNRIPTYFGASRTKMKRYEEETQWRLNTSFECYRQNKNMRLSLLT